MAVSTLSGPPLLAFGGGVAWAVIASLSHCLGQAEPLQQYHAGYFVRMVGGALPIFFIERAGLSVVYSFFGFFVALAVWVLFKRLLSSAGGRRSLV